jgi:MFS family permease
VPDEPSRISAPADPAGDGPSRVRGAARFPFADVPGPFSSGRGPRTDFDEPSPLQISAMRWFWWDGFWSAGSESIIISYLGLYALAFGASNGQIGLLSSLSSLFAALAFVPGARLGELIGNRKGLVLAGSSVGRATLALLALVPFFVHGSAAIWIVIALASFRGFFAYVHVPAWTSLTADIVPLAIRGRYFASRTFGMTLATLAITPIAGWLIDRYSGFHGWQLVWLIAFIAGVASTWAYARIPAPPEQAPARTSANAGGSNTRGFLSDILSDRNFVVYLASIAVWNIALQAAGPFFNVYLVTNLHASSLWVGILAGVPSVTGLAGLAYLGRTMDRRGTKWLMVASAFLIPLLPLAWVFVDAPWQVIFINGFAGVFWAGYNLALVNMVMVMSPDEKRARYAAAFQTVTFAGAFVGPILGGWVIALSGFRAVFVLSAAGRLVGTVILWRFVSGQAPPVRRAPATATA